ncbi:hypothetical protein [Streptomyces avermitilis]|uniref:hypothetical protein n=1 Tax=Streptomyces avermitilis TaxID=33903 RepID=UPI0033D6B6E7
MPPSLTPGPITADQPAPPAVRGTAETNGPPGLGAQELCPLQEWGCTAALRQPSWHLLSSHSTSDGEIEYCQCSCNAIVVLSQGGLAAFTGPPSPGPLRKPETE